MLKQKGIIILGSLAFCLYRSSAAYLYNTSMGTASSEAGFVSNLTFVFAVNFCTCLSAFILLYAIRSRIIQKAYPLQWIACLAMAAGFFLENISAAQGIAFDLRLMLMALLCGFSLMLFCATWMEFFIAQDDEKAVLVQIVVGYAFYSMIDGMWVTLSPLLNALICMAFLLVSSTIVTILGNKATNGCHWSTIRITQKQKSSWFVICLCFFVLVGVVGIMHTSVIGSSAESTMAKVPMWLTRLASALLLVILVVTRGQKNDPSLVFKTVFPTLILIITLMPFLRESYTTIINSIVITGYQICGMAFFLFQLGEGRRLKLSSYVLSGIYMLGSSGFLLLGLSLGIGIQSLSSNFDLSLITLLSFSVIYPLALIAIILFFWDRRKLEKEQLPPVCHGISETSSLPMSADYLDTASVLTRRYQLTKREAEILQYLVCGRTIKYIANYLVISENTVWTHAKRIYSKTGTHGKQGLITLVEQEVRLQSDR